MTEDVVLAPGLWNPGGFLWPLASRLRRAGFAPHIFSYGGRGNFDASVERLARFAHDACEGRPAHFLGYSLGGVLVLETLNRHPELPVASALLVGAPVRGSFAGRRFGEGRFGRWLMGGSASRWDERSARWTRPQALGVIAGTVPLGLGRAVGGRIPGTNDGVVRVEETAVDGMAAQVLVPRAHSAMLVSSSVSRLAERFLRTGGFE